MKAILLVPVLLVVLSCSVPGEHAVSGTGPTVAPPVSEEPLGPLYESPPRPQEFSVIAYYETRFTAGGNRGKNVERAAIQAVLEPGAIFSFNSLVGPRTVENRFLWAPVIFKGEMTTGEGGGVCQVSSTIHAAARIAGLEIVERRPHSRPSSYVPLGMDSTVVWPTTDLRIRNSFEIPVEIRTLVFPSEDPKVRVLRAEIRGISEAYSAPKYFFYILRTTPFEKIVRRPKPGGSRSARRVQAGSVGKVVASVVDWGSLTGLDGEPLQRLDPAAPPRVDRWRSEYRPVDEIWEVGEDVQDLASWEPPK